MVIALIREDMYVCMYRQEFVGHCAPWPPFGSIAMKPV